jgi:hypothetical protein
MRFRTVVPFLSLLLVTTAASARAEGSWALGLSAGASVSTRHGSALDARLLARVNPALGIGFETGVAYMNDESRQPPVVTIPVEPGGGIGTTLNSLTDGITRNRGYYLGPVVRVGTTLYGVASAGRYELSDNAGEKIASRWGASFGVGLAARGRFAPSAELRYRWAGEEARSASAWLVSLGLHIQ